MRVLSLFRNVAANALAKLFSPVRREREEAKDIIAPKPRHMVKLWRRDDGRPFFGPVVPADRAFHHLSRQSCRHYLRVTCFAFVSQQNPLMSRRDRRRLSRVLACLEYRNTMADKTNLVDEEMAA